MSQKTIKNEHKLTKNDNMNTKVLLLSVFTVFYFLGTQWFYSNKLSGACCGAVAAEEVAVTEAAAAIIAGASLPLGFKWMNADPILGQNFEAYKTNSILKGMKEDNVLQITGQYYKGEKAPEGYDNMGLARAAAIRDLIKESVPIERIDISSRLIDDNSGMETAAFAGTTFNWMEALKKETTTIVEVENESTIYFPFNSSVKDKNEEVDNYLQKLSERLKQTQEKVSITGHTDNVGEEAANMSLGFNRAESIKNILVAKGIEVDRISVDSKGELQPATTNETDDGRYRNRRTVLRIN